MNKKILIIDDDVDLSLIVRDMLEDYGFAVSCVFSAEEAYEILQNHIFHLILLDINLPLSNGFEVCMELRTRSTVPVIFASARTSESDKITGLDMGGDDYLAKPYSLKELLSRINSLIRRAYGYQDENQVYRFGTAEEICLSAANRTVTKNGQPVALSLKEFDLLAYLASHRNQSIAKETLLREVWGTMSEVEIATVAVHIRWLREKLEEFPSAPRLIKTVWGVGYLLAEGGVQ